MSKLQLPFPRNHLPFYHSNNSVLDAAPTTQSTSINRRDFMKLAGITAAGPAIATRFPLHSPVAAQSLTSSERELLLLAIDAAKDAGAHYADARIIRSQFEAFRMRGAAWPHYQLETIRHTNGFFANILRRSRRRCARSQASTGAVVMPSPGIPMDRRPP